VEGDADAASHQPGQACVLPISGADKAMILNEVLQGPRDPERLPSQFITPVDGIHTLLLDQAAASFLPAPDAQGNGVIERSE